MTSEMIPIIDTVFKDDTPLNTVNRIKDILNHYGIQTVEHWNQTGVPYCYSLRVSVFGTAFGTNGKGVTKELALASGYGELMERLQLGRIFKEEQQKGGDLYTRNVADGYFSDKELLRRNKKWYSLLAHQAEQQTGIKLSEENILKQYCDEHGNTPVTSFYCLNTQTQEYLPAELANYVYTANGCAAGNTMEEAIVQAISEIVERHVSMHILSSGIAVPDIPEEVLRSCTISYKIITFLRNNNFRVVVKDCSLGTKFPVVCVCLIDQNTGKYHTHFGAYPNFEIALQRTLTESFQGRNLQKIARFENFAPAEAHHFNVGNLLNQLVKGTSEKRADFFLASSEAYRHSPGFSGKNNRELLKECIAFITEQGYDILIRDHSCLGFPTYQVIIPGYSEVFSYRMVPKHNDSRYFTYAQTVLRNPSAATIEEIMGFLMHLSQISKQKLASPSFSSQANLPVVTNAAQERYLMNAAMASVNYILGRKTEVIKHIDRMLSEHMANDEEYLICIKRYLMLCADRYDKEQIRSVLEYFHKPETVCRLYSAISENKNPMEHFTLHCNLQCQDTCPLKNSCRKSQTDALAQIVHTKQTQMDRFMLKAQLDLLLND